MTDIYWDGTHLAVDRAVVVESPYLKHLDAVKKHSTTAANYLEKLAPEYILFNSEYAKSPINTCGTKMVVHRKRVYCDGDRIFASATTGSLVCNEYYNKMNTGDTYEDVAKICAAEYDAMSLDELKLRMTESMTTFAVGEKFMHAILVGLPTYTNDDKHLVRNAYIRHTAFPLNSVMSSRYGTAIDADPSIISIDNPIHAIQFMRAQRHFASVDYESFDLWSKEHGRTVIEATHKQAEEAYVKVLKRIMLLADRIDNQVAMKDKLEKLKVETAEMLRNI